MSESTAAEPATFPPPASGWLLLGVPILGMAMATGLLVLGERLAIRWAEANGRIVDLLQMFRAIGQFSQVSILSGIYLYLVIFLMLSLLIPKHGKAAFGLYLRRVRPALPIIGVLTGIICAFGVIYAQVLLVQNNLVKFHATKGEQALAAHSAFELPLILLMVSVLAPLIEEFYFRGLLLGWLRRRVNVVLSALISAGLFALAHGHFLVHPGLEGWVITGLIGIVGLLLATLAIVGKSLWPSMAAHGAYNATLMLLPFVVRSFLH